MYCVSCGSIIGDDFRFCEFCGMPNADAFAKEGVAIEENAPENAKPPAVVPPAPQQEPEAVKQQEQEPEQPAGVPICVMCGNLLKPDSQFCEMCGAPVDSPKQAEPRTSVCKKCGRELDVDSVFCDKCGAPVSQTQGDPVIFRCKKCGFELEEGFVFCDRCGARQ